ncbi:helix-turn-helix transcriptional regulator [Streptomyces sparsogenes]|uniref:AraC family transcriptional regulator n=1 Tax=Streptomyces sparsogenes DSM 40356 TaxID=1331668 RepID=A0A1R1S454_9ACTN|nr:helix-turn-helix transcriptional regulator [Streptomyces sparsogenes]OMI33057.1 AraC family transcriptional regulator [Streptomyces sparsogenes DSM 40356]
MTAQWARDPCSDRSSSAPCHGSRGCPLLRGTHCRRHGSAAALSPAHFSRYFKAAFGESPHQYLLTRRLERAAALLPATDWTVTAIGAAVGARSIDSFTTSFRRTYGMTPQTYRAAHPPAARHVRIPRCVAMACGRPRNHTFREDVTDLWVIGPFTRCPAT